VDGSQPYYNRPYTIDAGCPHKRGRDMNSDFEKLFEAIDAHWTKSSPYFLDINKLIETNDQNLPTEQPVPLTSVLTDEFRKVAEDKLFRILNDVEKLAGGLNLEELIEFLKCKTDGYFDEPPRISGAISTWLGEVIRDFNKLTGLGNEHRKRWNEWAELKVAERGSAPNWWSADDRIEKIGDDLYEIIKPELKKILVERTEILEHRFAVLHLSLRKGEVFSGNRAARRIFTAANASLDIIETYLGPNVFDMLEVTASSVQIRLLTENKYLNNVTRLAFRTFKSQYPRIELRTAPPKEIHDRYIIIDNIVALHPGHSIKDWGTKMTDINRLPDVYSAIKEFERLWPISANVT
jgi:hypothetical protein